MVPWVLSIFRPRLSYFIKGTLRRYLFWSVIILFGGPYVLKEKYAKPLIGVQKTILNMAKNIGQTIFPTSGEKP